MSQPNVYNEDHIIECNRSKTDKAIFEDSDTNAESNISAEWTTILGDVVHIDPGDKISMFGAYINERGCGTQGRTIEIKGEDLNVFKDLTYSDIHTHTDVDNVQTYQYADNTQTTDSIALKDNEANIGVSYYKNADGHHYYFGARRFMKNAGPPNFQQFGSPSAFDTPDVPIGWSWTNPGIALNWTDHGNDLIAPHPEEDDTGRPLFEIRHGNFRVRYDPTDYTRVGMENMRNFVFDDYREYPQLWINDAVGTDIPFMNLWKPKNDNAKFTMFVRRKASIFNHHDSSSLDYMPFDADMSPANTQLYNDVINTDENGLVYPGFQGPMYQRYIEKKTITIPSGFNSGEFIANEITRQLSQIKKETNFNYEKYNSNPAVPIETLVPQELINTLESECYKPFNVSGSDMTTETKFDVFKAGMTVGGGGARGQNWTDWFNQFQFIGIKRPELYETGYYVNRGLDGKLRGSYGAWVEKDCTSNNQPLVTSIKYTKENLLDLKKFLDAQAKYPEIWDNIEYSFNDYTSATTVNNTRWFHMNKYNNSAQTEKGGPFEPHSNFVNCPLGCDGLREQIMPDYTNFPAPPVPASPNLNRCSYLFFTHYDPSQKDIFYDVPTSPDHSTKGEVINDNANPANLKLSYGCFGIYRVNSVEENYSVVIFPNMAPTPLAQHLFNPTVLDSGVYPNTIEQYRKIGFDLHFNAPTTVTMTPMNGEIDRPVYGDAYGLEVPFIRGNYNLGFSITNISNSVPLPTKKKIISAADDNFPLDLASISSSNLRNPGLGPATTDPVTPSFVIPILRFLNQVYMGASSPKLAFDGNHFAWSYLHTPNQKGNSVLAGLQQRFVEDTDAAQECYKLNPNEQYNDYTPERTPYDKVVLANLSDLEDPSKSVNPQEPVVPFIATLGGDSLASTGVVNPDPIVPQSINRNLIPYQVYDSKTGIFIEDWGYTEDTWADGLWAILGFTYAQFHDTTNSRLNRITKNNINNLSVLTTNAEVVVSDAKLRTRNPQDIPTYTLGISHPWSVMGKQKQKDHEAIFTHISYPEVVQNTKSIEIKAQRLPKSTIAGYYGIRCDIMQECGFNSGQRALLPILGICPKETAIGDFFFTGESDMVFTSNKKTSLSSIKISVTDPDGSLATCSPDSTVLIKVSKPRVIQYNIAEQILADSQQKK